MGNLKTAFDSITYAIAALAFLFLAGMLLGNSYIFAPLFSLPGFVIMFFLIFGSIAK